MHLSSSLVPSYSQHFHNFHVHYFGFQVSNEKRRKEEKKKLPNGFEIKIVLKDQKFFADVTCHWKNNLEKAKYIYMFMTYVHYACKIVQGPFKLEVLFMLQLFGFWHQFDYLHDLILSSMAFLRYICILLLSNYFILSISSIQHLN